MPQRFVHMHGVILSGPPPKPLEQYAVIVKDDKIWVSRETSG